MTYTSHISVLESEVVEYLTSPWESDSDLLFLDLTLGGGGHASKLLENNKKSQLIAFDQDSEAITNANLNFAYKERATFYHSNFNDIDSHLNDDFHESFNGILMDLGVSTHQLLDAKRGLSLKKEGPLDMRLNQVTGGQTAKEWINGCTREEIEYVLKEFGEERFYKQIAANIEKKRKEGPIETTMDLENIIFHSYPKKMRYSKIHPATKSFQAIRIFINDELKVLKDTIPRLIKFLKKGARLCVISFHGLEDRIVKQTFKQLAQNDSNLVKLLTKKPISPSSAEISRNVRSRSAKMRVIQRA